MPAKLPYYLGCPAWSNRDWIGTVFPDGTAPADLLRKYSRLFNTVEGNTLFYALPPAATLERWMAESAPSFRFAPKFPKAISHERRLHSAKEESKAFFKVLETLADGDKLGLSFLQLPPSFNINNLDTLTKYLKALPKDYAFAVEPRHISWYDQGDNEKRLDDLLETLGMDKVIFDSRPLFSQEADDHEEQSAMERKPQMPIRRVAISQHPMLRFIGRNDSDKNHVWIKEWAPVINKWILEGKRPYIFAHAADDAYAPFVARRLHQQLAKVNPLLPQLPDFESDRAKSAPDQEQLDLF
ncbi:DUF72 domain-containing protein [Pelagicoccus sp. SDUM812003]|uniref:DUF72 domain-containing protein n=1 Tax=Pelagicoccus sp. SDUM812003 TaxID=3041267 RepID=UPI00280F4215|nr:DUF72 domain-containing protein [Pelagicoccus sp. SDUM812003]MDQ8204396.1 DUF72 domain-containing protein [Pelagicoccus sp. SDUM812003]